MGKKTQALLILYFAVGALPVVFGIAEDPEAVESWFKKLGHAKEKVTKLHFYFHDTFSGQNPTSMTVAQGKTTFASPTFFGMVTVIDDPLTVGPDPNSKSLGRAQGLYSSTDQHDVGLLMSLTYVFTEGKFNGSTLSVLGRNPAMHKYREMPIVSGTGIFRLARGIATAKTYSYNATTGDAVVEYNVVVVHY